ncbi:glycoside hydrolase family 2 TIM barrel-domain containing protein, partial [Porphyromonas sp.]|uniref:glycoside hydrolase family 2 TIM barrel-domain containing protein n=1 Tax=Porphyromonas sp. TaxID=1924944 RepID=UPI00257BDCB0
PGHNFVVAYDSLKAYDASRPVQYERNNDIVDMGSNQYPSIAWTRDAVKGKMGIKYPFHISEYAHSMGNAVGNLVDYWEAMESTNFFMGGAIWDWIDQSMYNYTKDGKRYLAYGGDFGDTPNDGQFVMNGIIFGDETPKPQYYEVKKVYQYIGTSWKDAKTATLDVFNKNYYSDDLSGYAMSYSLTADGLTV